MELVKKEIVCNIENLIVGYCYNFLSYLYQQRGWKRVALDTCKQLVFDDIKITISQSGSVIINAFCFLDILKAIEKIEEEFTYGRMHYYLVYSEKVTISTNYTDTYRLKEYIVPEETEVPTEWGTIYMNDSIMKFKYNNVKNGEMLRNTVMETFLEKPQHTYESKQNMNVQVLDEKEEPIIDYADNNEVENPEKYLYTLMFVFSLIKLGEYIPV